MELVRIGEKIISREKLYSAVEEILALRTAGYSQQEVAIRVGVDRTFVSRLETLGEVRKGQKIAVVGFPILNADEIKDVLRREGVDYFLILSEKERWDFVRQKSGIDLFNNIMEIIAQVRAFDTVIIIGSNQRVKIIKALLNNEVIGIEIGESPIEEDKYLDPEQLKAILQVLQKAGEKNEKSS